MSRLWLCFVVVFPIFVGFFAPFVYRKWRDYFRIYLGLSVLLNSIIVWGLLFHRPETGITLFHFTGNLTIAFELDGLGCVFAGLVSFLWPLATLYSFEYMTKEEHEDIFFLFYTMTYGVTLGIALADNFLTMYCFYELLTLVTVPLVMHTLTREAILASRKYLCYSIGGAAFAFIGMIFIILYGTTTEFVLGGVLEPGKIGGKEHILLLVYIFTFLGFGVKAAVCPFNSWLPQAGVAPTPVTALLHAVAVVKSGAFAAMRVTYYSFGTEFLRGSFAQHFLMVIVMFTILYGCSMALKETHLKRRLAYSTISNLSYILFGVVIMTPLGLGAALTHMVCHAFMKICSFFCAGAIMHQTGRHYIYELEGFARKMPKVFAIFTISAVALMGAPGLCGFISKWNLAAAALDSGNLLELFGIGCLLGSALLTAMYMLTIVVRGYFPGEGFDYDRIADVKDPNWRMLVPLTIFAVAMFLLGIYSQPFVDLFLRVAQGSF